MRRVIARILSGFALVGILALPVLQAQAAPKGSTGKCTDGTFTSAKTKSGACSSHGGVATWFADTKPAKPARAGAPAPAPKGPPAGATGKCNDGTYTKAQSQQGACSSHGGVAQWFATSAPARPAPAAPPPAAPAPAPAAAPAGAPADATALCNDGTYSHSQHRSGTCSQHKGVKQWLKQLPPQ